MRTFLPLAGVVLAARLCAPGVDARAAVVSIACDRDNTLFEDADGDTSSGTGDALYAGRNSQGRARRALVRFALDGAIPARAHVDSVTLTLRVASAPDTIMRPFGLHRITRDWGEGASAGAGGSGAPAAPGDATWQYAFFPTRSWTTPGGDFEPLASATSAIGDVGPWSWTGEGLRADVTAWLADPASNFGWLVLCGDETFVRSVRRFAAREANDPAQRPVLRIAWSDAVPASPASWGRVKASYR